MRLEDVRKTMVVRIEDHALMHHTLVGVVTGFGKDDTNKIVVRFGSNADVPGMTSSWLFLASSLEKVES